MPERRLNTLIMCLTLLALAAGVIFVVNSVDGEVRDGAFGGRTTCYAIVDSPSIVAALKSDAEDHGFSLTSKPGRQMAFESSGSDDDAQAFRNAFQDLAREHQRQLGQPEDGCVERGLLD